MSNWIPFSEIDFSDETIESYHIDTRDFCVSVNRQGEGTKTDFDLSKTKNYPSEYFFSSEEMKELIERYFEESGSDKKWRFFSLSGSGKYRTQNWQLKYIRIYRLENNGESVLIVYDRENKYLYPKQILNNAVNNEQ